jgi:hypothetical protein
MHFMDNLKQPAHYELNPQTHLIENFTFAFTLIELATSWNSYSHFCYFSISKISFILFQVRFGNGIRPSINVNPLVHEFATAHTLKHWEELDGATVTLRTLVPKALGSNLDQITRCSESFMDFSVQAGTCRSSASLIHYRFLPYSFPFISHPTIGSLLSSSSVTK